MPRPLNTSDVRKMAMALPDVEETTAYGMSAFKAGTRRFAGTPIPRPDVEPNTLGVSVSVADRAKLLASRPDVYYLTDHYVNYPAVLVRLSRLNRLELREILTAAWAYAMEKKPRRPPAKRSIRAGRTPSGR